jgi:hypothetical protein
MGYTFVVFLVLLPLVLVLVTVLGGAQRPHEPAVRPPDPPGEQGAEDAGGDPGHPWQVGFLLPDIVPLQRGARDR